MLYEFECPGGHCAEEARPIDRRNDQKLCPECGLEMDRVISKPTLHTMETHMRGYRDFNPAHGEYVDPNLFDRRTGKSEVVKSPKHKQELLKKYGKFELGESKAKTRKDKNAKYVIPG